MGAIHRTLRGSCTLRVVQQAAAKPASEVSTPVNLTTLPSAPRAEQPLSSAAEPCVPIGERDELIHVNGLAVVTLRPVPKAHAVVLGDYRNRAGLHRSAC